MDTSNGTLGQSTTATLSDLLELPVHGRATSQDVEPVLFALQSEKDVKRHCDDEGVKARATAVAKIVFRSLARSEITYANVWQGLDLCKNSGTTACRLLETESSIVDESHVNGARCRINALLFALHYRARCEGLSTRANRETAVLQEITRESGKTSDQIKALLKRGRWCIEWVNELGLGAILTLGDSLV